MDKGYESFLEELKKNLIKDGGYAEDNVKFERRQPKERDRILVKYKEDKENEEFCLLYAEEAYENFTKGLSIQEIVEEICTSISMARKCGLSDKRKVLECFESVKEFLFIRPLNADKYADQLCDAVCLRVGEIALVLFVEIYSNDVEVISSMVKKSLAEKWQEEQNMTEEELMDYALNRTMQTAPPRVFDYGKMIENPSDYTGDEFMELSQRDSISRQPEGNCISTEKRTNGAVAVFLPGVKEYLFSLLGDFYLAFTSVHEVMVHSAVGMNPRMLKEILQQVIEVETSEEDYLSSKIYYYNGTEAGIVSVTE